MKQIFQTMRQVIFEIFGDMFFMFPEEYEEAVAFPPNWIKYRISVSNGKDFFLNFYFTPGQAKLMAENFLGEEAGDIDETIIDETLKEAVNVLGGNLLNRIEEDLHLGIPEKCTTESADRLKDISLQTESLLLNIEDEPFLAAVTQS